jgi:uncharacterized repeat protein (TIGR03803 family)
MKIPSRIGWKSLFLFCLAGSIASQAQTFTTLVTFDGANGAQPYRGPLVQGLDGNIYGTTNTGGAYDCGAIFKVTPEATLTVLKSFCHGVPAIYPSAGLVQTLEGNFYGTTAFGTDSKVFWINPEGRLNFISTFPAADGGESPEGALVLASDGNLYGTTQGGGTHDAGTVFKDTPEGSLTTLYDFCVQTNCADGAGPIAGLVEATDGNFYGTTSAGATNDDSGTVFKITPEGALTTLYSFCAQSSCTDGYAPIGGLMQSADGNFYGTTYIGGANTTTCGGLGCGTIFKITPAGTLTTLYSFCGQKNCTDGAYPSSALVQGTDGNFYGTTVGPNDFGTIFKITPQAALTTLYRFCTQANCADGGEPYSGLLQATSGVFYGTTYGYGADNDGTIFSLDVGLGPFVETLPKSGAAGNTIDILSQGLTGTTAVSFNGTAASFTVVSDTYLTATTPSGATTGLVTVTTPSATLNSNQKFRVTP